MNIPFYSRDESVSTDTVLENFLRTLSMLSPLVGVESVYAVSNTQELRRIYHLLLVLGSARSGDSKTTETGVPLFSEMPFIASTCAPVVTAINACMNGQRPQALGQSPEPLFDLSSDGVRTRVSDVYHAAGALFPPSPYMVHFQWMTARWNRCFTLEWG